jgi:hypothetical protein
MPDNDQPNSISGATETSAPEPRQSLREIAEAAYDEGSTAESEAPSEGRARDSQGRFAPKQGVETGEAEGKTPPSPDQRPETPTEEADPAQRGNRPPDHWSAEDRAVFERAPADVKQMLQRRYSEMEADYTRKSQANAAAVQAVNALAPVFQDPVIAQAMQEQRTSPLQLIHEWAGFHKKALSPNVADRAALMIDLASRMGFDPAKLFATNRQPEVQLPPGADKDPAIRYLADQHARALGEVQNLRNEFQTIRQQEAQKHEEETLRATRWNIDAFADEKGQDGKPLRPDFDQQLPYILELFQANPERDLNEAYNIARRMNPKTWEDLVAAEKARVHSQQSVQKAQAANRGNLRGLTSPVSKPAGKPNNGSLRDALEASADEVGF